MKSTDAYARLVDEHQAALYRFALCLTGDVRAASRLTCGAFKRWKRNRHHWCEDAKAKMLLFASLYHEYSATALSENGASRRADEIGDFEIGPDADAVLAGVEDLTLLLRAFGEVEETRRAPLAMHYTGGFSPAQIARVLDCPVATVAELLSEGRAELCVALRRGADERRGRTFVSRWLSRGKGRFASVAPPSLGGVFIWAGRLRSAFFRFCSAGRDASNDSSVSDS